MSFAPALAGGTSFLGLSSATWGAIGTGMGAFGLISGGLAAQRTGQMNAQMALAKAEDEKRQRLRGMNREMGAAVSRYGASGVRLAGTPMEQLEEILTIGEEDLLAIDRSGKTRAAAARTEGDGKMLSNTMRAGSSLMTYGIGRQ